MAGSPIKDMTPEQLKALRERQNVSVDGRNVQNLVPTFMANLNKQPQEQVISRNYIVSTPPPEQQTTYTVTQPAVDAENDAMIRQANAEYLRGNKRLQKALQSDRQSAIAYNRELFQRAKEYDPRIADAANVDEALAKVPGGFTTPEGSTYYTVNTNASRYEAPPVSPSQLQYTLSQKRSGSARAQEYDSFDMDTLLPALKLKDQERGAYISQITNDVLVPNALSHKTMWRDYRTEEPANPIDIAKDTLFGAYWILKDGSGKKAQQFSGQNKYGADVLAQTRVLQDLLDNDPNNGRNMRIMNGRNQNGFNIQRVYSGSTYPTLVQETAQVLLASPMFTKNWDTLSKYIKSVGPRGNPVPDENRKQAAAVRISQQLIEDLIHRGEQSPIK